MADSPNRPTVGQEVVVDIPMGSGVDQGPFAHLLDGPRMETVQNMHLTERGAYKRRGPFDTASVNTVGMSAPGRIRSLFEHDGRLVCAHGDGGGLLTAGGVRTYSESSDTWGIANDSAPPLFRVERVLEYYVTDGALKISAATIGAITVLAWQTTASTIWYAVLDTDTLSLLQEPRLVAGGANARFDPCVVTYDVNKFAITYRTATVGVQGRLLTTTSWTLGTEQTLVAAGGATRWHAHAVVGFSYFLGIWASGTDTTIIKVSNTLAVTATNGPNVGNYRGEGAVAIAMDPATGTGMCAVVRAASSNDDVYAFTINDTLAVLGTAQLAITGNAPTLGAVASTLGIVRQASDWLVTHCFDNFSLLVPRTINLTQANTKYVALDLSAVPTSSVGNVWGQFLVGAAFVPQFAPTTFITVPQRGRATSGLQLPKYHLVQGYLEPGAANRLGRSGGSFGIGTAINADGSWTTPVQCLWPVISRANATEWVVFALERPRLGSVPWITAYRVVEDGKAAGLNHRAARSAGLSVVAAGEPTTWDGVVAGETMPPECIIGVTLSGTGNPNIAGTVQYKALWATVDAEGNFRRGAPAPVDSVIPLDKDVEVHVIRPNPTCFDAELGPKLHLEVYATEEGGTVFYRVRTVDPDNSVHATDLDVVNVVLTGTQRYGFPSQEGLYTDTGELPHFPLPAVLDITSANGRLIGISGDNPNALLYTAKETSGVGSGTWWHPTFIVDVPTEAGKAVAVERLGEYVVVLTEEGAYWLSGEGPSIFGVGDSFTLHRLWGAGAGCVDPNTVVSGPFGVVYGSPKGLVLIRPDMSVDMAFGEPVQDHYPVKSIYSAAVSPKRGWAVWAQEGRLLIWDWVADAWFVWIEQAIGGGGPPPSPADFHLLATWKDEVIAFSRTSSTFYIPTDGTTADVGSTLVTPWIKIGALNDFARVKRAIFSGILSGGGDIRIRVGYDYEPSWTTQVVWEEAEISSLDPLRLEIHLPRQKVSAIRFEVSHIVVDPNSPPTTGAGLTLAGITLLVQTKKGPNRTLAESDKK